MNNSGNFFIAVFKKHKHEGISNIKEVPLNNVSNKLKTIDQELFDMFGESTVKTYFDKFDKEKKEKEIEQKQINEHICTNKT